MKSFCNLDGLYWRFQNGKIAPCSHVQTELEDVLEELDVDQSGGIDFAEFLQFMIQ